MCGRPSGAPRRPWPASSGATGRWPSTRAAYLVVRDEAAAEDIAQEAFLAAIRALGRFDRRRPFGPWLHRIVINRAIDWGRARALRGEVAEGALAVKFTAGTEIDEGPHSGAARQRAPRALPREPCGDRPALPARLHPG